MESIGKVNKYICNDCNNYHLTVNLNTGTTPFGTRCPYCNGFDALSQMYKFHHLGMVTLEWCWYRPTREDLCKIEDDETVRHILRGGLIKGKLGEVTPLLDQVIDEWEWNEFADWCEKTYGQRPSMDDPWFPIDREKLNGAS